VRGDGGIKWFTARSLERELHCSAAFGMRQPAIRSSQRKLQRATRAGHNQATTVAFSKNFSMHSSVKFKGNFVELS
jgi:hypothetical protein